MIHSESPQLQTHAVQLLEPGEAVAEDENVLLRRVLEDEVARFRVALGAKGAISGEEEEDMAEIVSAACAACQSNGTYNGSRTHARGLGATSGQSGLSFPSLHSPDLRQRAVYSQAMPPSPLLDLRNTTRGTVMNQLYPISSTHHSQTAARDHPHVRGTCRSGYSARQQCFLPGNSVSVHHSPLCSFSLLPLSHRKVRVAHIDNGPRAPRPRGRGADEGRELSRVDVPERGG